MAITFGELVIGSPRRRIAATRVAATKRAPFRRSSVLGGSGTVQDYSTFAFYSSTVLTLRQVRGVVGHEYCMQNPRPGASDLS